MVVLAVGSVDTGTNGTCKWLGTDAENGVCKNG